MNQIAVLCVCALALSVFGFLWPNQATAGQAFEEDVFATSAGELKITFLGHGSLILAFGGKIIHVDPYGKTADYAALPKADAVLVTHEHQDHLDRAALGTILKPDTELILSRKGAEAFGKGTALENGERKRPSSGFRSGPCPRTTSSTSATRGSRSTRRGRGTATS